MCQNRISILKTQRCLPVHSICLPLQVATDMSSSVFGDPPPGTDLTASRRGVNNAAVSVTYVLAAIAIALRFFARSRVQQASIAADDWMIVAALVCACDILPLQKHRMAMLMIRMTAAVRNREFRLHDCWFVRQAITRQRVLTNSIQEATMASGSMYGLYPCMM